MCPGSVTSWIRFIRKQAPWKKQTLTWITEFSAPGRVSGLLRGSNICEEIGCLKCLWKCMSLVCTLGLLNQNHTVYLHLRTQISASFYHTIFIQYPLPHSSLLLQCSETPCRTQPLLRLSQISLYALYRTSVKLINKTNLHICVRLLNEVLSLLPALPPIL